MVLVIDKPYVNYKTKQYMQRDRNRSWLRKRMSYLGTMFDVHPYIINTVDYQVANAKRRRSFDG